MVKDTPKPSQRSHFKPLFFKTLFVASRSICEKEHEKKKKKNIYLYMWNFKMIYLI